MKIYLAGRYSRREELAGYAAELRSIDIEVTSRWLDGSHELSDPALADGGSAGDFAEEAQRFAIDDYLDVMRADVVVTFTEPPRTSNSRGGRHVEFGLAIAAGRSVVVVGPRENLFHCLPQVKQFETWEDFAGQIIRRAVEA